MLTCRCGERIRPFKSIGPFHSQVPALSHSRSGNRHAPFALSPTECVLQVCSDVAAQLSVSEILWLNCYSHPITILSKTNCPTAVVCVGPARLTGAPRRNPFRTTPRNHRRPARRLRPNEFCPIHRSLSCCGRETLPKPRLVKLGVQRVEDPHHPRGYRELRSPAEMRKLLNRKVRQQAGICAICSEEFTDYNDIVPDHKNPKGMGGA